MNPIADDELAAYVLGDAPAEVRARVEAAVAADEGFAAEVAALAALARLSEGEVPLQAAPHRPTRRHPGSRRAALAAAVLLAVGGTAWGGYELLRTPPLLDDDFGTRTVSHARWEPHLGRRGASAPNRYLRLLNRGSVVTRAEFEGPVEITLDWRWVDEGQWPLYAELFTVALRTHGGHKPDHPYEISDGLLIEFNTVEGSVRALNGMLPGQPSFQASKPDSAPLPAGEWHRIRITDDGEAVAVFVEGPSIDPKYKKEPILRVTVPAGLAGKRVAFFNREYVAGTNHESHVDNVTVRPLRR